MWGLTCPAEGAVCWRPTTTTTPPLLEELAPLGPIFSSSDKKKRKDRAIISDTQVKLDVVSLMCKTWQTSI